MLATSMHPMNGAGKILNRLVQILQLIFDPDQQIYGNRNGKTYISNYAKQLLHTVSSFLTDWFFIPFRNIGLLRLMRIGSVWEKRGRYSVPF